MSVTDGLPSVIVPVLSSTTVVTCRAVSSASPLADQDAGLGALAVPTMIAVGVASPRAQGQAMISTATAFSTAKVKAGVGADEHPDHESQRRYRQDGRHEVRGDDIGQALDRRLRTSARPAPAG